jgi:hypothetical protein
VLVRFHRDIEVLRFGLLADEGTVDFNHERTVQGLYDLQLSRFVPAVLLHPFHRNDLVTVADAGSEDAAESAASNQILHNKIAFSEFFLFLTSIQGCCVMGTLPAKGMTVVQTECFRLRDFLELFELILVWTAQFILLAGFAALLNGPPHKWSVVAVTVLGEGRIEFRFREDVAELCGAVVLASTSLEKGLIGGVLVLFVREVISTEREFGFAHGSLL